MSIAIRAGTVITGNGNGDVLVDATVMVDGTRIISVNHGVSPGFTGTVVDARNFVLIPGFVQTHVHLCQTLFRGMADDLPLLDWLRDCIFPFEAAHNECSMSASASLGIAELIRSGTTTILDMGSVHHEEAIIHALGESGLRAFAGKAMMDMNDLVPKLKESTDESLKSTRALAEKWHDSFDGRLKYAVAPRFVLSCSERLLKDAFALLEDFDGMIFHTHASENRDEVKAVYERCHMDNIEFLDSIDVLSERSCLAHCIHLKENEIGMLRTSGSSVTHCPSSNLKLGSGVADIPRLLSNGITVALGADGAPCNNNLNMFQEMRLASLLQKPAYGPTAMPARKVFEMATLGGARALHIEQDVGSIEPGKKADIVLLDLRRSWNAVESPETLFSSIVFSSSPENVDSVMIDGKWVYREKEMTTLDEADVVSDARKEFFALMDRL